MTLVEDSNLAALLGRKLHSFLNPRSHSTLASSKTCRLLISRLYTVLQLALSEGLVEPCTEADVRLPLRTLKEVLELALARVVLLLLLLHGLHGLHWLGLGRGRLLGLAAAPTARDGVAHNVAHSGSNGHAASSGSHLCHQSGLPGRRRGRSHG